MAMSLHDHQERLNDLEAAFAQVAQALQDADPTARAAIHASAAKLRAGGADGAAALLLGDRHSAGYRR